MEVLVIAAHPDDEVLGLGGTISKLAAEGNVIHHLIITDGSSQQYLGNPKLKDIIEEKKRETCECASILGIKTIDYASFPDMKLDTVPHVQINECIERTISKYSIEMVFTHFYGDVNKDHRCVFESSIVATRPFVGQTVKTVLLYKTPSSTEWNYQSTESSFSPNVYVNITDFEKNKLRAISCYKRELRQYPHPRSLKAIEQMDCCCGTTICAEFAESFILVRGIF